MNNALEEISNYCFDDLREGFGNTRNGESVEEHFTITDDLKADWAIKIIKQEESQAERLIQIIDQEIEILNTKKQKIKESANCGFLKGKLADYYEGLAPELLKKQKHIPLINYLAGH